MPTVTKDEFGTDNGKYAGLHVDSWDRLPLRYRHRARNRLCINFGREPRYLLFINLTLMRMFHQLGLRDPEDIRADYRGLHIGHRFMKECITTQLSDYRLIPGKPILCLRRLSLGRSRSSGQARAQRKLHKPAISSRYPPEIFVDGSR